MIVKMGFTLIELLVVIVIIGVLSAIAIGAFMNQRQKAFNATAKADLHNVVLELNSYFVDEYPIRGDNDDPNTFNTKQNGNNLTITFGEDDIIEDIYLTDGVIVYVSGEARDYTVFAKNIKGTQGYRYTSKTGAITEAE